MDHCGAYTGNKEQLNSAEPQASWLMKLGYLVLYVMKGFNNKLRKVNFTLSTEGATGHHMAGLRLQEAELRKTHVVHGQNIWERQRGE